eukprot:1261938-Prymnesium_polylepis.3
MGVRQGGCTGGCALEIRHRGRVAKAHVIFSHMRKPASKLKCSDSDLRSAGLLVNCTFPLAPTKLTYLSASNTAVPFWGSPDACMAAASEMTASYANDVIASGSLPSRIVDASKRSFAHVEALAARHAEE